MSDAAEPVTAVLLSYARPYHIDEIVESLLAYPFVKQVVIWDNNTEHRPLWNENHVWGDRVFVHRAAENIYTLGRFVGAWAFARHSLIWFQDDDVINEDVAGLYRLAVADCMNSMIVALPDDHSSAHYLWYQVNNPPETDIGFGSFVRKEWIRPCFQLWQKQYPNELYLLCRKADKVFTILHGRRCIVRARLRRLNGPHGEESGRDANALWLREDHKRLDARAILLCLQLREKECQIRTDKSC